MKTKIGDKRREQYPGPRNPRFGCHPSQKGKGERQKPSFGEGDEGIKQEPARERGERGGRNFY